jgi:hypothetical protein
LSAQIDTSVPHPARRYDYWLGGKDNFAADRESGDAVAAAFPTIKTAAIENRRFMHRAVRHLADAGVRQFLDIGCGIPTSPNTHEIAQAVDPAARVVYVDNDPIVLTHARALLTSHPDGVTDYIDADVRDPDSILTAAGQLLDLREPVGLLLVAVLHFVVDAEDPYGIVGRLVAALPPGSYLVVSHSTYDLHLPEVVERLEQVRIASGGHARTRSRDEVTQFFSGLQLVEPGVVSVSEWRPEAGVTPPDAAQVSVWGAVGRVAQSPST